MSAPQSVELIKIVNMLKSLRTNINVPLQFHDRMDKIKLMRSHDKTGMVNTILDFMIHSATVPMKIETKNENLNNYFKQWQKADLNKNISIDVPRGLRELTTEYHRERLFSSFIVLNVRWGKAKLPDGSTFEVPTRMWIADGSSIYVEGKTSGLNTKQYFIGPRNKKKKELKNTTNGSILIRKPFNSLYEVYPTPFLVKRGILFNALLKEAIITKQADVIESVIPYLLLLRAGTDKLAELQMLAGEEELKDLKDKIVKATSEHDATGELGKLIASLNYDVNVEHLIPDLTKIFSSDITNATDKNLLAGLGMIELQGFASNRQETILNPKVLVEEVKDSVADWATLLEEVMYEMLERNKRNHPKLANNEIRVVPGKIKAFVTDEMRAMFRSLYDRGLFSRQAGIEEIGDGDFEVELDRLDKESNMDLKNRMKPPVIQNLEQYSDPELENQDKKPGTPEADNFNNAILQYHNKYKKAKKIISSNPNVINTPDGLPEEIKLLSEAEQFIYWLNYNFSVDMDNKTPEEAHSIARNSINLASAIKVIALYDTVDNLPDSVKNVLPIGAQIIFLSAFNSAIEQENTEESVFTIAWSAVKRKYKKNKKNKWVKK